MGQTRRRIEYMVRHPAYKDTCQYATITADSAWAGIVTPAVFQAANDAIDHKMVDMGRAGATRTSKMGVKMRQYGQVGLECQS